MKGCACGCGKEVKEGKTFAKGHRTYKDPTIRFWQKVKQGEEANDCWEWQSSLDKDGYGGFCIGRKINNTQRTVRAHRFAYELLVGPIPEELVIDHLCRNPRCVNVKHLEVVTNRENIFRGISPAVKNANRTHCIRGHEFNAENMRKFYGKRSCRICNREWDRERYRRKMREAGYTIALPASQRTQCPYGHPYAGKNLVIASTGARQCRACRAQRDRDRRQQKQKERKSA